MADESQHNAKASRRQEAVVVRVCDLPDLYDVNMMDNLLLPRLPYLTKHIRRQIRSREEIERVVARDDAEAIGISGQFISNCFCVRGASSAIRFFQ